MVAPNDKDSHLWPSQNARLGSFLIASSFLVVAYIQLVTADNKIIFLNHTVAALGGLIAFGYFLMNFWLVIPDWLAKLIRKKVPSSGEQLIHTWLIPLSFLMFWIVAWVGINEYSPMGAVLISAGLFLIFIVFLFWQKHRDEHSQKK